MKKDNIYIVTEGKKILVSCHVGVSRSALLALIVLAEEFQSAEKAWWRLKTERPHIDFHDNFQSLVMEIFEIY
jgi:Dual specificity phosphatase, catalytic domain.